MSAARLQRIDAVLQRRQTTLTVLMEDVHKPHNYSAVLRSCDAVGIGRVHVTKDAPLSDAHRKISAGASSWVDVVVHASIEDAAGALPSFTLVAAHPVDDAIDYREYDYTQPTALLLGAEREGLSVAALRLAKVRIAIPMHGMVRSFNVSVACGIILAEAERQRARGGLYSGSHLNARTLQRLRMEWAQPEVAAHCRRHGLSYPELDADGDVVSFQPRRQRT
jgi:tRNA (guanosine-2'-O-)-methyltransferase